MQIETIRSLAESIGLAIEGVGVLVIVIGLGFSTMRFFARSLAYDQRFRRFRQDLGNGILLGLEFLVAGDIIRTVAVAPTLQSVTVLGLIVIIRTFLSWSIAVELEGRWPWQSHGEKQHNQP